jgi:hypothetical protein
MKPHTFLSTLLRKIHFTNNLLQSRYEHVKWTFSIFIIGTSTKTRKRNNAVIQD